jgi:hypothetical protein
MTEREFLVSGYCGGKDFSLLVHAFDHDGAIAIAERQMAQLSRWEVIVRSSQQVKPVV